ncbi:MAG: YegS/Rv2252/BmrU family lipid kinase [Anaeromyxobacter sp.]
MGKPAMFHGPADQGKDSPAPRTVLLVNAAARRGQALFERAREELVRAGFLLAAAEALDDPEALPERLREALRSGAERVVVGGGDGTQSAAAAVLAGTGVPLGVLPMGTGNDLARGLGLPIHDLRAAARALAAGEVRDIDLAEVNGRPFLNAAAAGLAAAVTRRLHGGLKRTAGPLAYPVASAVAAAEARPFRVRLGVDGEQGEHEALQVLVGNGRYHGGGHLVAPDARLDDHRLDVYVVEAAAGAEGEARLRDLARLARYGARLLRGRHLEDPAVVRRRGRVVVVGDRPAAGAGGRRRARGPDPGPLRAAPGGAAGARAPLTGARFRRSVRPMTDPDLGPAALRELVLARTAPAPVPLVPELTLLQAGELTPLWHATAAAPAAWSDTPFWAYPWAGGQALARHLLDHPALAAGRAVVDFASGSGLVGIAAARAGARSVLALDQDPFCAAAIALNAERNGVALAFALGDAIGRPLPGCQLLLAGDVFYERALAERSLRWFRALAAQGVTVLAGDAGRSYAPAGGFEVLASHEVPTTLDIEATAVKAARVLRILPEGA